MKIVSWKNKRVIVTGSRGFIGTHLTAFLQSKNAVVLGVSRSATESKTETTIDLTDKRALEHALASFKPDVVFHLASDALVETGQSAPYNTFYNNIISALNVLEISKKLHINRLIMASSVHVYGNAPLPFVEDEPARPSRPYETSKTAVDLIAQSYADTFNLPVLIPRFVNIYGPGDRNMSRIIPKTVTTVLENKNPSLWGGGAKRDYLYIDDAIRAYDLLARISDEQIEKNRIFNFATGKPVTAKKLIQTILRIMNSSAEIILDKNMRSNEVKLQEASFAKAKNILGWKPKTTLTDGLKSTLDWYKNL